MNKTLISILAGLFFYSLSANAREMSIPNLGDYNLISTSQGKFIRDEANIEKVFYVKTYQKKDNLLTGKFAGVYKNPRIIREYKMGCFIKGKKDARGKQIPFGKYTVGILDMENRVLSVLDFSGKIEKILVNREIENFTLKIPKCPRQI